MVVVSNSGASCVLSADAAVDRGLQIAAGPGHAGDPGAAPARAATTGNPVDITTALLSNNGLFGEVLPPSRKTPRPTCFLIDIPVAGRGYDVARFAADTARFAQAAASRWPWWPGRTRSPARSGAWRAGVCGRAAGGGGPGGAVAAAAARTRARGSVGGACGGAGRCAARVPVEAASLALLAAQGIAVGEHALCANADAAVAAWRRMGAPVALKACSARLPHKSEHGLVALGINDEAALREAIAPRRRRWPGWAWTTRAGSWRACSAACTSWRWACATTRCSVRW